jgi:sulfate/thiosulfate transport system substrate-binding protein
MGIWLIYRLGLGGLGATRWLRFPRWVVLLSVGVILSLTIAACSHPGTQSADATKIELTLVSFSVTKSAHEVIIPKFVAKWQQEHGQTVEFKRSYGGSGAQARAVIEGLDADVVHLALALDTQKIAQAGLIQPGWETKVPNQGIVSRSVAALITRAGNPKSINNWSDLARDDVKWITADPKTSGVARWNFMALWHVAKQQGNSDPIAQATMAKIFQNVPVLTRDAREASDVFFKQGQGDALINYENEIILAQKKGQQADYRIPDVNISIDNPIAIVDKNVNKHHNRAVAEAFVQFLYSPEAQTEFARLGFRSVNPTVASQPALIAKFPAVKNLATIQDYGGWGASQQKFFDDGAIFDQIRAR